MSDDLQDELDAMYAEAAAEPYLPEYRPQAQQLVDGVPLNPRLRPSFEATDNAHRDPQELRDWWGRPFIVTASWEQIAETWERYTARHARAVAHGSSWELESREQFEAQEEARRQEWFRRWPEGTRYEVRRLDGGAWDRSTWRGAFPTLDQALACAKELQAVPPYGLGLYGL